jgi:hypothetical protein
MSDSRRCGICLLAPREGDPMGHIRLHDDDVAKVTIYGGGVPRTVTSGCYQACTECIDRFRPVVSERLWRTHDAGNDGRGVFDAAGNPVMVLPAGSMAYGNMLL